MPDIIPLELDFRQDGGDAGFHDTNSFQPSGNKTVLLITYAVQQAVSPAIPLPSVVNNAPGPGLAWSLIFSQLFDHGGVDRARVTVYRGLTSSPSLGTTRIGYTTVQLRFATTVIQFSNTDIGAGGLDAIVQTKTQKILADVTRFPNIVLDNPAENPANAVVGICGYGDTDTAQNPQVIAGAGFTLIRNNPTTETGGQAVMFRAKVQQDCDWIMNQDVFDWAPMAIELRNAQPAGAVQAQTQGRPAFIAGNLIT